MGDDLVFRFPQMNPGTILKIPEHMVPKGRMIQRPSLNVRAASHLCYPEHFQERLRWIRQMLESRNRVDQIEAFIGKVESRDIHGAILDGRMRETATDRLHHIDAND